MSYHGQPATSLGLGCPISFRFYILVVNDVHARLSRRSESFHRPAQHGTSKDTCTPALRITCRYVVASALLDSKR